MLYPEIPEMQTRAIIRAALAVLEREGETAEVEIMIPLVAFDTELNAQGLEVWLARQQKTGAST